MITPEGKIEWGMEGRSFLRPWIVGKNDVYKWAHVPGLES